MSTRNSRGMSGDDRGLDSTDSQSPTVDPERRWAFGTTEWQFGALPRLMGIVNATPDSFSDGGLFLDPQRAADHALQLVDEGADLIDVGGESTRPGAQPVPLDEELPRVVPV